VIEKEYLTDAFAREAVAFIDRHKAEPFFLYLAFNAVHVPLEATEDRLQKFAALKGPRRRTYAAMTLAMDEAVGRVLRKLRREGLEDDTLVFFLSDNGGPLLPGTGINGARNTPLRGSKRTTLEGGIRVPFVVSWKGRLPGGTTYDRPVIQLDVLPTALAAAGVRPEAGADLDGVNLLPYLAGQEDGAPHEALYWRLGAQMAVRRGDWKLVRYDPAADGFRGRATATRAKLYNLARDVGEAHDLAADEPARAKDLEADWRRWGAAQARPLWEQAVRGSAADEE
jgi:arylsulfatase A-like enzyme